MLRKALLALFVVLLIIITGCTVPRPDSELTDEQTYKLQLIEEIKAFEKELGFNETDNFKTYSDEIEG